MRRLNRYCLERQKPCMSWNPQNCFNIATLKPFSERGLNIFQIEWKARMLCRRYFNGDVAEKVFRREFNASSRDLLATFCKMERRIDNSLFRCLFATSVFEARRITSAGMVLVNGIQAERPSQYLNDGDVLQIKPEYAEYIYTRATHPMIRLWSFIPKYLEVNFSNLSAVFLHEPQFDQVPHPFSRLVIDNAAGFYSKRG
jgi:ribosomal protein S4